MPHEVHVQNPIQWTSKVGGFTKCICGAENIQQYISGDRECTLSSHVRRFSTLAGATLLSACVIISGKIHFDIASHPPVFALRITKDCEIEINSGACCCIESKWIWTPNAITAVNAWFDWIPFNLWFVLVYAIAAPMDGIQSEHSTPHDTHSCSATFQ